MSFYSKNAKRKPQRIIFYRYPLQIMSLLCQITRYLDKLGFYNSLE